MLYPAPLRDLLVQLATTGIYRAKWTDAIHEEWTRNVLQNRPDLDPAALARTRKLMNAAVLDCLVDGYDVLIPSVALPDPHDRHVLAAAIHRSADVIVTLNLKDFPAAVLQAHNVEAVHPDDFIHYQFDLDRAAITAAVSHCRRRLTRPPMTPDEYLAILKRNGLVQTATDLKPFASVI